jgi:hypothetical protein
MHDGRRSERLYLAKAPARPLIGYQRYDDKLQTGQRCCR